MPDHPLQLAVVIGSTREGRFGPTVARWFVSQAEKRADFGVAVVDLADMGLPAVYPAQPVDAVHAYARRIGAADAFVVVTPEYNHGYPASLKQAIDLAHREWRAKPVGFVSYGGMAGGLRAVEQLRLVFAELHAVTIRDTVSFHNVHRAFDPQGQPVDAAGTATAARAMLDELAWWARALHTARATSPYAA